MIFMTSAMMFFIFKGHIRGENAIDRHEGAVLVLIYIGFLIVNIVIGG
jgi:Ca2+/Na+ antiporter